MVSFMKTNEEIVNDRKGILVVYEGISGSGKSESINKLTSYFSAVGLEAIIIEWNSNSVIRTMVRKIHHMGILTPTLYSILQWISFFIDYITIISPSLRKNQIVIADRYIYTAITRDTANGAVQLFSRLLSPLVRKPDWVIFYDTPAKVCYERIKSRGKALFHPNKSINKDNQFHNKDLDYLSMLRNEYIKVFAKLKDNQATNILLVSDDEMNTNLSVEHYIYQKMGNKNNTRVYSD
jgi:dTMP kinase